MSHFEDNMTRGVADHVPVADAAKVSKYPRLPAWYRQTSSFTAQDNVSLETLFQSLNIRGDADCLSKSTSLEGVLYSPASNVSFEINFFENAAAETVVEVARQAGCSIKFHEFFTAMQMTFGKNVVAKDGAADGVAPALAGDAAAASPADTESVLADALNIAKSPRETTAAEGFALVASTVEDDRHQANVPAFLASLHASELSSTLKMGLAEQPAAVRVSAAVAVAALAQHSAALPWVASEGLVELMIAQCQADDSALTELQKRELYRQVARCVARAISASVADGKVTPKHLELIQAHFAQTNQCKRDEEVASDFARSVSSLNQE
jgi:hypothetical protein